MKYRTILIDPPWKFSNSTGKVSPGYSKFFRYASMTMDQIAAIDIPGMSDKECHLYLWTPNALLPDAIRLMQQWGFTYKTNVVWHKIKLDGSTHRGGVGFYFRNATEILLFGVKGKLRTHVRDVPNIVHAQKREHSRKPDEFYSLIEQASESPRVELFARSIRSGWDQLGDELGKYGEVK